MLIPGKTKYELYIVQPNFSCIDWVADIIIRKNFYKIYFAEYQ